MSGLEEIEMLAAQLRAGLKGHPLELRRKASTIANIARRLQLPKVLFDAEYGAAIRGREDAARGTPS